MCPWGRGPWGHKYYWESLDKMKEPLLDLNSLELLKVLFFSLVSKYLMISSFLSLIGLGVNLFSLQMFYIWLLEDFALLSDHSSNSHLKKIP